MFRHPISSPLRAIVLSAAFWAVTAWQQRLFAQTSTAVAEPQYINQFFALQSDGTLLGLEQQKLSHQMKAKNLVIFETATSAATVMGPTSPVRLPSNASFVVRGVTGDTVDPNSILSLRPFIVQKGIRVLPEQTHKINILGARSTQGATDNRVAVTFTKYGQDSLLITPAKPLAPGEYVLQSMTSVGGVVFCFGVDAGSENVTNPQPAATKTAQSASPPPPPSRPTHPASTVVDYPPAAPGYPPMHASAPAPDGCWWTPFVSTKLGLEMLVQNCEPGKAPGGDLASFGETDSGVASITASKSITELFTVHDKPALQPITSAIRKQFISTLPIPAARTSCQPIRDTKYTGPGESYNVIATGPYSKLKKFNTEEIPDEYPCPGVGSDDVVGRSFLYLPDDSKTKFIFFQVQEQWPFDEFSIRFRTELKTAP